MQHLNHLLNIKDNENNLDYKKDLYLLLKQIEELNRSKVKTKKIMDDIFFSIEKFLNKYSVGKPWYIKPDSSKSWGQFARPHKYDKYDLYKLLEKSLDNNMDQLRNEMSLNVMGDINYVNYLKREIQEYQDYINKWGDSIISKETSNHINMDENLITPDLKDLLKNAYKKQDNRKIEKQD